MQRHPSNSPNHRPLAHARRPLPDPPLVARAIRRALLGRGTAGYQLSPLGSAAEGHSRTGEIEIARTVTSVCGAAIPTAEEVWSLMERCIPRRARGRAASRRPRRERPARALRRSDRPPAASGATGSGAPPSRSQGLGGRPLGLLNPLLGRRASKDQGLRWWVHRLLGQPDHTPDHSANPRASISASAGIPCPPARPVRAGCSPRRSVPRRDQCQASTRRWGQIAEAHPVRRHATFHHASVEMARPCPSPTSLRSRSTQHPVSAQPDALGCTHTESREIRHAVANEGDAGFLAPAASIAQDGLVRRCATCCRRPLRIWPAR